MGSEGPLSYPPDSVLSQTNPVHTVTPYFLKIHLKIVLSCMTISPKPSHPVRDYTKMFRGFSPFPLVNDEIVPRSHNDHLLPNTIHHHSFNHSTTRRYTAQKNIIVKYRTRNHHSQAVSSLKVSQ